MRNPTKWARVLSLSLLSGAVFARGASADPPTPPPAPGRSADARDADIQAQLDAAQKRLEDAARQVADLSTQLSGRYLKQFSKFDGPFGRVIIGVQLDPDSGKEGARVVEVSPGGPAAEAGIKVGDVIVNVNGKDVTGEEPARQVMKIIRDVKPDDKVVVRIARDGSSRTFSVKPRQKPDAVFLARAMPAMPDLPDLPGLPPSFMVDGPLSNMELVTLSPHLGKYFGTDKGVLVVRAPPDGLKLEDGDVILAIDGREPSSGSHATRILGSYQPGEKVTLRIVRERKTLELQSTMPAESGRTHRTIVFNDGGAGGITLSNTL